MKQRMRSLMALSLLVVGCGDDEPVTTRDAEGPPANGTIVVTALAHSFEPREVQIFVGQRVRWLSASAEPHTVTSGTGSADPLAGTIFDHALPQAAMLEIQFDQAGEYPYFCVPHEAFGMNGVVRVMP